MNTSLSLLEEASAHVTNLFREFKGGYLLYHNLQHTKSVVKRSMEIARNYAFSESELFILYAAAWFHDTGHLFGGIKLHELRSVRIMEDFFETKGLQKGTIDKIGDCICATKLSQTPASLLVEVICDEDTYNLGTRDFIKIDKLLKKEYELRNIAVYNWEKKTLNLLLTHQFFTPYCQALLNRVKEKNIEIVKSCFKHQTSSGK
jgi:predicted metal-dependent HD superfamily phosphohydrolase